MKIFDLHSSIISDYSSYIYSFLNIKDKRIQAVVEKDLDEGKLWPDPLIQFNPTFEKGESIEDLVKQGLIHSDLNHVFKGYSLYKHQVEAIKQGVNQKSFIVTSGTGSGKSLTFLSTIFNYLIRNKSGKKGIKAILVYPMNALINSQEEEIKKYAENYEKHAGKEFPITFAK
ncbi:MAG: DEAD/DEAH box helicase, partial [Imperialibacter sp.]